MRILETFLSAPPSSSCRIESSACDFPFRHDGFKKTSCIYSTDIDDALSEEDDYFCKQNRGSLTDDGWDIRSPGGLGWSWGVCDEGCFDSGSDCESGYDKLFMSL